MPTLDAQPFPSNPTFQPRPPVSEATKSSIYASVKSKIRAAVREAAQDGSTRSASAVKEGPILREVAQKHNISVLRLRAIVKLKVLEEAWKTQVRLNTVSIAPRYAYGY